MDVKSYISSGILELFVLGKLSAEEEAAVIANADKHHEIRQEIEQIELAMEQFANLQRVIPPAGTLSAIMDRINQFSAPSAPKAGSGMTAILGWLAFGLAALIAGYYFMQLNDTQQTLQQKNSELQEMIRNCAQIDSTNSTLTRYLEAFQNTSTKVIILAGSDLSPESRAKVLYNPDQQEAFLAIADLPPPPTGKQYQLWALVDGQPVDLGVFDADLDTSLLSVPYVAGTGAFAVTLEIAGGQPTPNLDQLYLIGNVG